MWSFIIAISFQIFWSIFFVIYLFVIFPLFSDKSNVKPSGSGSKMVNGAKPGAGSKSGGGAKPGNLSDDEPLYDSVCSDEDYASIGDNQSMQDGAKPDANQVLTMLIAYR